MSHSVYRAPTIGAQLPMTTSFSLTTKCPEFRD